MGLSICIENVNLFHTVYFTFSTVLTVVANTKLIYIASQWACLEKSPWLWSLSRTIKVIYQFKANTVLQQFLLFTNLLICPPHTSAFWFWISTPIWKWETGKMLLQIPTCFTITSFIKTDISFYVPYKNTVWPIPIFV